MLAARLLEDDRAGRVLIGMLVVIAVAVPLTNLAAADTSPFHVPTYTVTLIGKYLALATLALSLDLVLASALARLAAVMVVVAAFVLVNGQGVTAAALIALLGLLCGSLILVTLLGMATGRIARSNGEVHLFGAMACGLLAFISGIWGLIEGIMILVGKIDKDGQGNPLGD